MGANSVQYVPQKGDILTENLIGAFDTQKFVLVTDSFYIVDNQVFAPCFSGSQAKGNLVNWISSTTRPFTEMSVRLGTMPRVLMYRR
ncbi:MAG: hypothetical protein RLZZ292_2998 [Bacteroidota bacterium]|jgi:hypothetical protein